MLADKGAVVEEAVDLRFFRPLGIRVARALEPTGVTPDQVTSACLMLGLVAGHLFFYDSIALNALGLTLFLASDVLDSADGQLARLRGTSTRFGRMLDGVSDNLRFINLYVHLVLRLTAAGASGVDVWGLAIAAGASHSLQSGAADFVRQAWLFFVARAGELDLPETTSVEGAWWGERWMLRLYRGYVRRQTMLFPETATLARAALATPVPDALGAAYATRQQGVVRQCAWIAQNIRFALLAVTACVGWPMGFFWLTVGPLNVALIAIWWRQERNAADLLFAARLTLTRAPAHAG